MATRLIGRSAKTGRFITVASARAHKATAIVQRLPVGRKGR
jgi:hypothetical protein